MAPGGPAVPRLSTQAAGELSQRTHARLCCWPMARSRFIMSGSCKCRPFTSTGPSPPRGTLAGIVVLTKGALWMKTGSSRWLQEWRTPRSGGFPGL